MRSRYRCVVRTPGCRNQLPRFTSDKVPGVVHELRGLLRILQDLAAVVAEFASF